MSLSILGALGLASENLASLKAALVKARETLVAQKERFPDLAAQIDPQVAELDAKIAALDEPLSEQSLAALAVAILPELVNISKGKLEPKPHAGDSI